MTCMTGFRDRQSCNHVLPGWAKALRCGPPKGFFRTARGVFRSLDKVAVAQRDAHLTRLQSQWHISVPR